MWMTPFYLFFGTLFVYIFQSQLTIKKLKHFCIVLYFYFSYHQFTIHYDSITKQTKEQIILGKKLLLKAQYAWDQQI